MSPAQGGGGAWPTAGGAWGGGREELLERRWAAGLRVLRCLSVSCNPRKSHFLNSSSYAQHIELNFRAGIVKPVLV
ncbi:hypothetical protein F511_46617 [Dorcoceras hygrometricum]|uniref:Uncharacterized protein n=1 Tax=Dorcoceras hygrometricum TaxID=472368 RepID=A0A2Z6ZZZ2_9LAMI|nr:hypothetical protein F511_46617 [Dorcoceras hygrometricum]